MMEYLKTLKVTISLSKSLNIIIFVLIHSSNQVTGNANIESPVTLACHYVNIVCFQ